MKITGINIEVKETEEPGNGSSVSEVTKVELESHAWRKNKAAPLYCHFTIDLESGVDVSFSIEITYKKDMCLDQQWKKIIKKAQSSLTLALESLPSDDIFEYVDLVGDISPKS